jgi:AbrB family looped-hinge helix DNA binding protein
MDAAGRVVIPRAARAAAHLEPGTELEVRVENGVVQLEPAVKPARLVRRGRLLVAARAATQPPLRQEQVDQTLEEVRRGGSKPRR